MIRKPIYQSGDLKSVALLQKWLFLLCKKYQRNGMNLTKAFFFTIDGGLRKQVNCKK